MLDLFQQLPEPNRSNCVHSMRLHQNRVASSVAVAVLLLDWNCGFAPFDYYENLFHSLQAGNIQLAEYKPNYYDPIRN